MRRQTPSLQPISTTYHIKLFLFLAREQTVHVLSLHWQVLTDTGSVSVPIWYLSASWGGVFVWCALETSVLYMCLHLIMIPQQHPQAWAALTVIGIQDLNCCCEGELHHCHHWFRQQNLEGLRLLVLSVGQDANPPRSFSLSRVKLDLPLWLPLEVLILLCSTVLGADTCEIQADIKEVKETKRIS